MAEKRGSSRDVGTAEQNEEDEGDEEGGGGMVDACKTNETGPSVALD